MRLSLRTLSLATVAAATLAVAPAAFATNYTIGSTTPNTVGGPLSAFGPTTVNTVNYDVTYISGVFRDADGGLDFYYKITALTDKCTGVHYGFHRSSVDEHLQPSEPYCG